MIFRLLALIVITLSLQAIVPLPSRGQEVVSVTRDGPQDSQVVLFIPGLTSSGSLWQPWAESLTPGHRVVRVTAAGFAGVEPAGLETSFYDRFIPALNKLLEAEGAEDALVVGHSIGGLSALMLARAAPERVGRVLVVDSLPRLASLFMPGLSDEEVAQRAHDLAFRLEAQSDEAFKQHQAANLVRQTKTPSFIETLTDWSLASDRATMAQAMKETLTTDYRDRLAEIEQPVHVLAAWDPAMQVPRSVLKTLYEDQYANLPNGTVQVVDNSFHFVMIDRPEVFEDALNHMVAE